MTAAGRSERFRRRDRLRSSKDFRRVSREGTRMASRSFVLLVAGQREAPPEASVRLGITVSRRVGNAVVRARVKRNVREWFRRNRALAPAGRDIVVIAKPVAARASSQEVWRELARSFQRLASSECA